MLKWGLVLFVIVTFVTVNASLNISISSTDTYIGVCVKNILSRITESRAFTSDVSLIHIKDAVAQSLHGVKRTRFVTKTRFWGKEHVHSTIYVMHFNNYIDMKKTLDDVMEDTYWTPSSNLIISMEHFEDYLTNITEFFIFKNIYNVTLLSKQVDDYTIYSFHSPIQPCKHHLHLLNISRCSEYDGGSHIFPVISIEGFRGCRFKLAVHNTYPMVSMDNDGTEGYEQRIVKMFSKRHHFVIEFIEMHKIDKLERVVSNYSYVDMLSMVHAGRVEGAIGGYFLDAMVMRKFSFTYPVMVDYMIKIMPRANVYNAWLALYYKAFSVSISVLSLIVIFSVVAHRLALFPACERDPVRDFVIVFGFFLNKITIREMKKGIAETLISCSLLFSVFIIPYVMQAFLNSVQTHPIRGFEVKKTSEIGENYQLILPRMWRSFYNKSQACENLEECLSQVNRCKDRKHYTVMFEAMYDIYKWMPKHDQCSSDTYKLREPVFSILRTLYFRAGSVLVKQLDKFLFRYVAGGLVQKHAHDIVLKERLKCREVVVEPAAYEPLTHEQVRPAFVVLIAGSSLSFLCFAFEMVANK